MALKTLEGPKKSRCIVETKTPANVSYAPSQGVSTAEHPNPSLHVFTSPKNTSSAHIQSHSIHPTFNCDSGSMHYNPQNPMITSRRTSDPLIEPIQKPGQVYLSPYRHPSSSPYTASNVTIDECCAPKLTQAPRTRKRIGLTKSQRIGVLLAIDFAFFLVELIIGE